MVHARSKRLRKKYGQGAVVLSFAFGRGRVVHSVAHFQMGNASLRSRKAKALYRLVANLLVFHRRHVERL